MRYLSPFTIHIHPATEKEKTPEVGAFPLVIHHPKKRIKTVSALGLPPVLIGIPTAPQGSPGIRIAQFNGNAVDGDGYRDIAHFTIVINRVPVNR